MEERIIKRINYKSSASLVVISIIIASLMVFSFGCVKKEEKEIRIGAVFCMTGSGKTVGEDTFRGVELAVEQINSKGGILDKKIKLIIEDDQTAPQMSVTATQKLAGCTNAH